MTSPDMSKPKICRQFVAITKICELWQNLRSLLELAINSAIAESQNPGGTSLMNRHSETISVIATCARLRFKTLNSCLNRGLCDSKIAIRN